MRDCRVVTSTIDELMNPLVTTVSPDQPLGYVRELMAEHHISAVPVVNADGEPVGIVTATDLLQGAGDETLAEGAMATPVATVSRYDGPRQVSYEPSTAVKLKERFGFKRAVALDVSNACAGLWTAIYVVDAMIRSGAIRRGMVVSGESCCRIAIS